ncbi:MAG: flagellar assembly protein FliH [Gammaproteobacteria bacterium]|nr:flagellar assembly protein FliH [Rhodocyclaceae bacterium]MBU3909542.1 flagellar assembly protein FliH [Gammaproteobacteria bacterium]MBU3989128.1 flagellar assembly protein FliH [Gammaproteobacteria bacterium]MBU4003205.1 flagellar assembly protein FliH [Gammaproteobacteria bacterium]MBU4022254.1 flagellar assembly protein FliH [Gammaproteobacteria bacterium]
MSEPSKLTAWERWELASFNEGSETAESSAVTSSPGTDETLPFKLPTATEIEQIHQQARDEGYQKGQQEGYQTGLKKGHDETRGAAQKLAQAVAKLEKGLSELDAQVADELLMLAVELAREVLRQEISVHPETLLNVVREALAQLPHQHAAIYLHPDDASLLRSYMGDQLTHAGHRIHEDFKLARGDCVLESGGSQVDATMAMRWRRVLEGLGIASAWQPAEGEPTMTTTSNEP